MGQGNYMATADTSLNRIALRAEFIRILQSVLREDISDVTLNDDLPIRQQISMDSMDFLDFAIEVRKNLRIELPDEAIAELSSIRDWLDFAWSELQSRTRDDSLN